MKNFKRKNSRYISFEDVPEIAVETDFEVETPFSDILTEQEYKLLKAYYLDKEKIDRIAKSLDISKAAAEKRIYRVKTKIKKHMDKINNRQ